MIRRIALLNAAIDAVRTIRRRIEYFLEPLDSIMVRLQTENDFFIDGNDSGFFENWKKSVMSRSAILKPEEKNELLRFGDSLGKSDREGQMLLCGAMEEKLLDFRTNAVEDKTRFSRLAVMLPVFGGTALVILFM